MSTPMEILEGMESYSEELGLDLRRPEDRFQWLLASLLFAKRVSAGIAKATFKRFREAGLVTPERILAAGWDRLVYILDLGGYVRYDYSTATNLLALSERLLRMYGSLDELHSRAKSPRHMEQLLMEFKGIGPVCVNIFLRELRGIWEKANPPPSQLAVEVARKLKVEEVDRVESQLVRIHLEYCKRRACKACPVKRFCSRPRA